VKRAFQLLESFLRPKITTFNPVFFIVGVFFVVIGIWFAITALPSMRTVAGMLILAAIFVAFPISCGATIVYQQPKFRQTGRRVR